MDQTTGEEGWIRRPTTPRQAAGQTDRKYGTEYLP